MTSYWIKLYHEILRDPKMGLLDDHTWRRAIELFLIAGERKEEGRLPTITDTAWLLRTSEQDLQESLEKLAELGIAQQDKSGWLISNFAKRQAPLSAAERMRLYRKRKRSTDSSREQHRTDKELPSVTGNEDEPGALQTCYENRYPTVQDTDTDTDIDIDSDKEVEGMQRIQKTHHKPLHTPKMTGALKRLERKLDDGY
mgnify:CR=1 FL=1